MRDRQGAAKTALLAGVILPCMRWYMAYSLRLRRLGEIIVDFCAVSLSTGRFVWRGALLFNAETSASFPRHRSKRIVVLDNVRYYHAFLLKPL